MLDDRCPGLGRAFPALRCASYYNRKVLSTAQSRLNGPENTAVSPVLARLNSVSRLFGSFAALRQVTVDFEAGQCYVLLGENGAGKSTLLRILAGLLLPSQGS